MSRPNVKYEKLPLLPKTSNVENVSSRRIYQFGNNSENLDEEINTDRIELSEVRERGKSVKSASHEPEELFIEVKIGEEDTIHSLSLKYGCPVSELKRVNNLIRDQDFFALKTVKVPAKRHGYLLELVEQEQQNGISKGALFKTETGSSLFDESIVNCDEEQMVGFSDGQTETNLEPQVRTLSIRNTLSSQGREASDFLHNMDSDIRNIVSSTKDRLDSLEEVATKLTCRRIFPLRQKKQQSWGADCGIRWWNIVLIVFLIGLVTPLLYFVYYVFFKPP